MAKLYKSKAKDYEIYDGDKLTEDFKLWCWKLNSLTPQQFKQGVELMEQQEQEGRRAGDETWPPSYAGFKGLATMRRGAPVGTYTKCLEVKPTKGELAAGLKMLKEAID